MSCIRQLPWLFLFFLTSLLYSQENFTGFVQPQIALNYAVAKNYKHNFSLAQRVFFYTDESYDIRTRQLDLVHFSDVKIRSNQSVALGIQYRFRSNFETDSENELRLTQQYNTTFKPRNIRFGHRLRSEQRITPSLLTHRFRYRFALDLPLNGEQLDIGEAYIVASTESLLSVANTKLPEYDQRFTLNIGYLLNTTTKLQAGMEYRFEDYTHATEHIFFVLTSLVFSL